MTTGAGSGVTLGDLMDPLSLITDLGLGQPLEHLQRAVQVALRLADHLGLDEATRFDTHHTGLLAFVGCPVEGNAFADWFGDDLAFRSATYGVDLAGTQELRFLLGRVGAGQPPLRRARLAATMLVTAGREITGAMHAHCQTAASLAQRLGLGDQVVEALGHSYARWDGRGFPKVAGDAIALPMRLMHVADIVEAVRRIAGPDAAADVARARSGTMFDPTIAAVVADHPDTVLALGTDDAAAHDMLAGDDTHRRELTEDQLDAALEAVGDFADLRAPWFTGHSRTSADLAATAADALGLPAYDVRLVRRAGLIHDVGRAGIPADVLSMPGPLTTAQMERVRLHAYILERVFAGTGPLREIASLAALHHERLDGSGYHRGLSAHAVPRTARVLAAADVYTALRADRPQRPAFSVAAASAELAAEVRAGRLDEHAVEAVLVAAGRAGRATGRPPRAVGPAGLTSREIEVLGLLALGLSQRRIAEELYISPKTVGNHVEHIYTKLAVSSRAAAALFAMEHGLVAPARGD